MPSKRNEKIVLTSDTGLPPQANGSDIVTVIASSTDKDGYVKHLSQETIIFEVEGEGELVGGRAVSYTHLDVYKRQAEHYGNLRQSRILFIAIFQQMF